jgi:hypothetical protein
MMYARKEKRKKRESLCIMRDERRVSQKFEKF